MAHHQVAGSISAPVHNRERDIALFVNGLPSEYSDALARLSVQIGRPLRAVILADRALTAKMKTDLGAGPATEVIFCDFFDANELHIIVRQLETHLSLATAILDRNLQYLQRLLPHVPYVLGPTETSLEWSTQKGPMRDRLAEYDCSLVPKYFVLPDGSESTIDRIIRDFEFPLIVKPTGLASSILVSRVESDSELCRY